ncbi:MAG TPA: hypothetical protein VF985_03840, partial [Mariniflexile sp.]
MNHSSLWFTIILWLFSLFLLFFAYGTLFCFYWYYFFLFQKRKVGLDIAVSISLIIICLIGFFVYKNRQVKVTPQKNQTQATTPSPIPTYQAPNDWKTYRNEEYGFEFQYPPNLNYIELGPNFAQQAIASGEQISGTVEPSLETVSFANSENNNQFMSHIQVFNKNVNINSIKDYENSYLYLFGQCDLRWGFLPSSKSLLNPSNVNVLFISGNDNGYMSCFYLSNQQKLVVITTNRYDRFNDLVETNNVLNQILSTF